MKTGGIGGSSTKTGLNFEKKADFLKVLDRVKGYEIKNKEEIVFNGETIARHLRKHSLYKFLEQNKVDYKKILSKKLLPDDAIYTFEDKTLYVIEMKFQKIGGSVDEKLQTCDFKKKRYEKLMSPLGIKVEYIYILNSWFKQPCYKDTLNYIREVGCDYFFEGITLDRLGLPSPL